MKKVTNEPISPSDAEVTKIQKLLNNIEQYIVERTVLPPHTATVITLWILATYLLDCFRMFPRLAIISPERRCGKSTLLELLDAFAFRSQLQDQGTLASIFRDIDKNRPTMLLDEADTFIKGAAPDFVGMLNGSYKHTGNVTRTAKSKDGSFSSECFKTYCAMALASIRDLPDTIMDRSIPVHLKRKKLSEKIKAIPIELKAIAEQERNQLLEWATANADQITNSIVEPPTHGNDRAIDNWRPLFRIANQVGGSWPAKCEAAFLALVDADIELETGPRLLTGIQLAFSTLGVDRISSASLAAELTRDDDSFWREFPTSRPITPNQIARVLSAYRIKPKPIRVNGIGLRGYTLEQFEDAFDRYIEPTLSTP